MSNPEAQALAQEHAAIREGMLRVLHAWAAIENGFALLLRDIMGDPSGARAFAIYFAPSGMETRTSIVDAALSVAVANRPDRERFLKLWSVLENSLCRSKAIRNTVAHGQISTFYRRGNYVRLMPTFQAIEPAINQRQIPGYSSRNLVRSAEKVMRIREASQHAAYWLNDFSEASAEKLNALEVAGQDNLSDR